MLAEKNLKVAVVGASGTLGSVLKNTLPEAFSINRNENSFSLKASFDVTFICAPSGLKWFANKNPSHDLLEVENLVLLLEKIKSDRFILFSTVDALDAEVNSTNYYGAHRKKLEEYLLTKDRGSIVRLAALVAPFIKKNFLHDIKEKNTQFYPNLRSRFQFSNLYVWDDLIQLILEQDFSVFNYFSRSLSVESIMSDLYINNLLNTQQEIVNYCKTAAIGLSALRMDLRGFSQASALKHAIYAAANIPIISGITDPLFDDTEYPYLVMMPDSWSEFHFEKFVKTYRSSSESKKALAKKINSFALLMSPS